jgi:uracil DNA glycosylase
VPQTVWSRSSANTPPTDRPTSQPTLELTDLMAFVEEERSLYPDSVSPPANEVFRALELTWCEQTRVVIIGLIPTTTQVKRTGFASACRAGCVGPSRSSGSILSFAPMSR